MKKNLITSVFILSILIFSYFVSVVDIASIQLVDISLGIKDVRHEHNLVLGLKPQDYFLKVKFFKNKGESLKSTVSFNDQILKINSKKEKNDYLKLYFFIPKNLFKNSNNVVRINFEGKAPTEILANISNFKKRVSKDFIILNDKSLSLTKCLPPLFVISGALLFILLIFILIFYKAVLRLKNPVNYCFFTFSPFMLFGISLVFANIIGYKIIISVFMYWLIFSVTVGLLFMLIILMTLIFKLRKIVHKSGSFVKNVFFGLFSMFFSLLLVLCLGELFARIYMNWHYPVKIFKISDNDIS